MSAGPTFSAVMVTASATPARVCEAPRTKVVAAVAEATIEIVLPNGRRMIVAASIDPVVLARLLPVVEGA